MKTLVTLLFVLISITTMAQEPVKIKRSDDSEHAAKKKTLYQLSQMADSSQTYRFVYCLANYKSERTYAMGFAAVGGALALIASGEADDGSRKNITVAAGVCGFLSVVTFYRAERWLGRSELLLKGNSLAIRF